MTTVVVAHVARGEANWLVNLLGLPQGKMGVALGKTWRQARILAQETAEHILSLPPGEVVVDMVLQDAELQALIDDVRAKKVTAREAHADLDAALGRAARALTENASVRDVGEMLGYSHQHVAKLARRSD